MKLLFRGYIQTQKIKRSKKYQKLAPAILLEDFMLLLDDIKKNGQKDPVSLDQDMNLIDGFNRFKAIDTTLLNTTKDEFSTLPKELSQDTIFVEQYKFNSELEKYEHIVSKNRARRHLSVYQKCQMALPVYKELQKESKRGRKKKGSQDPNLGKTTERAAKSAGVSNATFVRFLAIENSPLKEKKQKQLEEGTLAIKTAFNQATRVERNLPKVPVPQGQWDVIECDIPEQFKNRSIRGSSDNHYPTMSPEELMTMEVPTAENAIMFFWISTAIQYDTIPVEFDAINPDGDAEKVTIDIPYYKAILDSWGFHRVIGEFVWVKIRIDPDTNEKKPMIGLGSWTRNQHEKCLIAVKGKMPTPAVLFPSVVEAQRTEHSKKPEIFKEIFEKMYPGRNYLGMFERTNRKGWTSHGNQLPEMIIPDKKPMKLNPKEPTRKSSKDLTKLIKKGFTIRIEAPGAKKIRGVVFQVLFKKIGRVRTYSVTYVPIQKMPNPGEKFPAVERKKIQETIHDLVFHAGYIKKAYEDDRTRVFIENMEIH